MNENRRVVVTGIGAVTPLGNTVKDTWENLKAGKNGIAPIRLFDTEKFKAKLGAEVKGFDPKDYLEVNDILRTDRYAQFAVAAAQQAVDESGVEGKVTPSVLLSFSAQASAAFAPLKRNIPSCWKRPPPRFPFVCSHDDFQHGSRHDRDPP